MSRLIVVDDIDKYKFHPAPYIHMVPDDANAESYKRGWNDAIDVIVSEAQIVERSKTVSYGEWEKVRGGWVNQRENKKGMWLETDSHEPCWYKCDQCGRLSDIKEAYCPACGSLMGNTSCVSDARDVNTTDDKGETSCCQNCRCSGRMTAYPSCCYCMAFDVYVDPACSCEWYLPVGGSDG